MKMNTRHTTTVGIEMDKIAEVRDKAVKAGKVPPRQR